LSLLRDPHETTDLSDRLRNKNNSIHSKGLKWITSLQAGRTTPIRFIFSLRIDKMMINSSVQHSAPEAQA
jgi:hypothetical protein